MFSESAKNFEKITYTDLTSTKAQYGHSQSEKKLRLGDKYYRSIKVHTYSRLRNKHRATLINF
jgi:hypothetical protein